MINNYQFACNCNVSSDINLDEIPRNCPKVWELLEKGLTVGIFQLDSPLGEIWSKKLKPKSIEDLTSLGAILRPGCLNSEESDGKSLTEHFCLRKNKLEESKCQFPALNEILKDTYYVLIYQEQVLKIGQEIAGLSLQEADEIRDIIAKKQSDKIPKVREKFLNGCEKTKKVTKEESQKIFEWIEASQRYLFNKAHSNGYAETTYDTAWMKVHFPLAFYLAKLIGAKNKIDSQTTTKNLIDEAKLFNIEFGLPDLRFIEKTFHINNNIIQFGICNIKGIGDSIFEKLKTGIKSFKEKYNKDISKINFVNFVVKCCLPHFPDTSVIKLIQAGAMNWFKLTRNQMENEYNILTQLTKSERQLLIDKFGSKEYDNTIQLLKEINKLKKDGGIINKNNRLEFLNSYIKILETKDYRDSPLNIAYSEENLLGMSITFQKIDACNLEDVNTTCKEFLLGKKGLMILGVDVEDLIEREIKRGNNAGKKMMSLKIRDNTGSLKAVAWSDVYEKYKNSLVEKNSVILEVERARKKEDNTAIIRRIWNAKIIN